MKNNFLVVFVVLVLIPIFIFFAIEEWVEDHNLDLDTHSINDMRLVLSLLATFSSVYILRVNWKRKIHSWLWYAIGALSLLVSGGLAFLIIAFSGFGF